MCNSLMGIYQGNFVKDLCSTKERNYEKLKDEVLLKTNIAIWPAA